MSCFRPFSFYVDLKFADYLGISNVATRKEKYGGLLHNMIIYLGYSFYLKFREIECNLPVKNVMASLVCKRENRLQVIDTRVGLQRKVPEGK